jgi:dolichol-phosphate mannosyltransferase
MSVPRLLVTLCTYNERENLGEIVPAILQIVPHATVLVIDDNSPDGTGRLADELAGADERVRVLHRPGKQGLGTAILAGFRYAIEHQFDWLTNLDADFSHHPRHLSALLECMNRCDVAIGSRYVKGGGVVGWGFRRHFMSQGINWYARLLLGLRTRDNSGRYRCKMPFQNPVAGTRTSTGSSLAGTRSRKRRCTAAARSAAGSRKPRSCSRTAATASRRSASRNRGRRSA